MKSNQIIKSKMLYLVLIFILFLPLFSLPSYSKDSSKDSKGLKELKEKILFGSGPSGGTFQTVANVIQSLKPIKEAAGFKIYTQPSEGSIENLKKIDSGELQMGIVYAGDLWRGMNGKIINYAQNSSNTNSTQTSTENSSTSTPSTANSPYIYGKVLAVASLYTASAQLVVHSRIEAKNDTETKNQTETKVITTTEDKDNTKTANSENIITDNSNRAIKSVKELEGKRVGVGNTASGAYSTCELFFTHIGLWDKIEKRGIGYNDAAKALINNELDAFWVFSAIPCPAVVLASEAGLGKNSEGNNKNSYGKIEDKGEDKPIGVDSFKSSIELINLGDEAEKSGFLKEYPWFSTTMIRGNTYKGVDTDYLSFQDYAILAVNADVSADVVYQMLSIIYSDDGLKYLAEKNINLKEMSIETGNIGIITPLHLGAERFWKEKGSLVEPTNITPKS